MGINIDFLAPSELFDVAEYFSDEKYSKLDMKIVFHVKDRETLQRISDEIYSMEYNSLDGSPKIETGSIQVNVGTVHFEYKLKDNGNNNNQGQISD